jgi:heat shock protein beta
MHFKAEGEISFKSILYIPEKASDGHYDKYYEKSNALKLYVRKVLISDEFEDFMPRYLNFIRGVVDSEDLPLNVSRETLAQSRVLKVMGKKLTRKALEMLRKLAEESEASMDDAEDEEEEKADGDDAEAADGEEKEEKKVEDKYATFWKQFGRSIKLGMVDDASNRSKLAKLLRFETNKSEDKSISLQDYVDDMAEGQKYIYYITGASVSEVKNSPFLEKLEARGFEVIYMVDTLDEYVVQNLSEFDGKKLMSATKDGLKFGDEGVRTKNKLKAQQEEFEPLTTWLKELYGKKVEKVVITNRLSKTPCIIVTGQYGWSANMERIMKAQTMTDGSKQTWMHAKKTLELNPNHPIIVGLKQKVEADAESQEAKDQANLLRDAAELQSGFQMEDSEAFAARIHRVLAGRLDVDLNEDFVDESNAEDDAQYDDPEPEPEPEVVEEEDDAVDLDASDDADADADADVDAEEPAAEEAKDDL